VGTKPKISSNVHMTISNRFKDAITGSLELEKRGEHSAALELLDQAITEAIRKSDIPWIHTLCHHAATMSRFTQNWASAKSYYGQSLASDPENPRALYGLAAIALEEGDPGSARRYARRCRTSILLRNDEILKEGLIDLIEKNWPDLAES
jgi:tetratricopeptide (TPR) repeat protein